MKKLNLIVDAYFLMKELKRKGVFVEVNAELKKILKDLPDRQSLCKSIENDFILLAQQVGVSPEIIKK